jgi:hypothetical protein
MVDAVLLPLTSIRCGTKQKHKLTRSKVEKHVFDFERNEDDVYPIDVYDLGDGSYTIAGNGRHRYLACSMSGNSHILAFVRNA